MEIKLNRIINKLYLTIKIILITISIGGLACLSVIFLHDVVVFSELPDEIKVTWKKLEEGPYCKLTDREMRISQGKNPGGSGDPTESSDDKCNFSAYARHNESKKPTKSLSEPMKLSELNPDDWFEIPYSEDSNMILKINGLGLLCQNYGRKIWGPDCYPLFPARMSIFAIILILIPAIWVGFKKWAHWLVT